mmetsp:Transcript_22243/g.39163  ORF Transcript_22243/g.39163 Transcript_22243/m.39163 type:complete len:238 (-) Transcript_22243:106-819(-)
MQYLGFVLAILACTGHGRRVQKSDSLTQGEADLATLLLALTPSAAFNPTLSGMHAPASNAIRATRRGTPEMFFLWGNNEESKKRREELALRDAPAGSRMVTFRKPNAAASSASLGLTFRDSWGRAVYVDKILPGSEAERFKRQGKIKEGDEVVMVSATFGDEMWSSRGIGKGRLEDSIRVRQGAYISFCLESSDDADKARKKELAGQASKEQERMNKLQSILAKEVAEEQGKGGFFW